jgi:hypothetical protein
VNRIHATVKLMTIVAALFGMQLVCAPPTEIVPLPAPTTAVPDQSRTKLKHWNRPLLSSCLESGICALNAAYSIKSEATPFPELLSWLLRVPRSIPRIQFCASVQSFHRCWNTRRELPLRDLIWKKTGAIGGYPGRAPSAVMP